MLREEFDDWAVLFDPDTGHGFGLSPTGVYVWKLLDGEHSIDDMLEALRRDAEGVPPGASEHLVAFVEELTNNGLVGREGEKSSDCGTRPCVCAGATKFTYEPPRMVNLTGESRALGDCYLGSDAVGMCGPGHSATGECAAGSSPATTCCGGNVKTYPCGAGGSGQNCSNGNSAGWCCQPGTGASG